MGPEVWKEAATRPGLCIPDRGGSKPKALASREPGLLPGGMRGDMRCLGTRKESAYFHPKMPEWHKRSADHRTGGCRAGGSVEQGRQERRPGGAGSEPHSLKQSVVSVTFFLL